MPCWCLIGAVPLQVLGGVEKVWSVVAGRVLVDLVTISVIRMPELWGFHLPCPFGR